LDGRNGLLLFAMLAALAAGRQLWLAQEDDLAFTPVEGLPGWRQVAFDGVTDPGGSATGAVLAGIDATERRDLSPADLCAVLYPSPGEGVPAAFFTDANCPNCRSLEAKLAARADALSLTRLQLPLLGPGSETAAQAEIAAGFLGVTLDAAPRGRGAGAMIRQGAVAAGIDPATFAETMNSPDVAGILATHAAAADTLGVWGTPALTLGTTLVMGDVPGDTLDRLIALEEDRPRCP